jgi:site-specific DNA recombinase
MKALIYCRVSSERQKTEGHGLDSQEQRCRLYCDQKGYEVEKVFRDSFSGGGDFMGRPAMRELLSHLDKHSHRDYVVVFDDLKRFARDTVFHIKLRSEFKAREVEVECLNYKFDESEEGEFIETVLAAQGELERKQNRRQVIQKQKARLESGYWPFNPFPGYRHEKEPLHGKLLKPCEPAPLIKAALEGFATGRFESQAAVQRFLQQEGLFGKKPVLLQWVNRMFGRAAFYAGFIEYTPWEVEKRRGHHEPIIDIPTYEQIVRRLNARAPIRTRKDMNEDFPLRHTLVVCGSCNRPLTASFTTKKHRPGYKRAYYRCNNLKCPAHTKSVWKETIELEFKTILKGIHPKPLVLKVSEAMFYDLWENRVARFATGEKKKLAELGNIQGEIRNLAGMAKRASSDRARLEYEKQIDELAKQEEKLNEETSPEKKRKIDFRTALRMVFDYLANPYDKWENGDLSDKKLVMNLVFEDVLLYDIGTGFRTAPLSLPLRVFEHFATSKMQGVEAARVELASRIVRTDFLQA